MPQVAPNYYANFIIILLERVLRKQIVVGGWVTVAAQFCIFLSIGQERET